MADRRYLEYIAEEAAKNLLREKFSDPEVSRLYRSAGPSVRKRMKMIPAFINPETMKMVRRKIMPDEDSPMIYDGRDVYPVAIEKGDDGMYLTGLRNRFTFAEPEYIDKINRRNSDRADYRDSETLPGEHRPTSAFGDWGLISPVQRETMSRRAAGRSSRNIPKDRGYRDERKRWERFNDTGANLMKKTMRSAHETPEERKARILEKLRNEFI